MTAAEAVEADFYLNAFRDHINKIKKAGLNTCRLGFGYSEAICDHIKNNLIKEGITISDQYHDDGFKMEYNGITSDLMINISW